MVYSLQNPLPPIDCLVAALAAMEYGSFSAAAEALDLTHASVSRRVATAENWVGYSLFDRHARGVRPTLDGQRLLLRLQKTFGELESLAGRRTRDTARNVVRIQTTPSLARFWLIPRLGKFEAGGISIELQTTAEVHNLSGSNIDIAIRFGKGGWADGKELARMASLHLPVVHKALSGEGDLSSENRFGGMPLLIGTDLYQWRDFLSRHGDVFKRRKKDRLLADYGSTIDAAQHRLGVALWHQALHDLPVDLVVLDQETQKLTLQYYLLAGHKPLSPAAQELCEILKREFEAGSSNEADG